MGKNIGHIQHIKSSVVENGQPKLPVSSVLAEGELAINYAKGYETISLLNSESGITRFSSDDYYTLLKLGSGFTGENSANTVTSVIRDNEKVIAAALNDLDDRKMDLSAYTPTDLSDYYTKEETSGRTEISSALGAKVNSQTFISHTADTNVHVTSEEKEEWNAKADESWVNEKLGSAFTGTNSGVTVTEYIEANEEVIAAALNDLNQGKLDASAYTPTDLSNYYTKDEIDDELLNYYTKEETSGATELEDAFEEKVDVLWIEEKLGSGFTGANSANTVTEVIETNEKVIAASLNDLDERKMDASAYTPTDLSNYYTKSQTSGATEISTALGTKENALAIDSTAKTSDFSAEVGKYYIVNVPNNGSVTVTLPTSNMSSTNVQSIVFLVTLGTGTASIAFTPIAFKTEGFNDMTAGNTYEVNALWNGTNWIMAMTKLEAVV